MVTATKVVRRIVLLLYVLNYESGIVMKAFDEKQKIDNFKQILKQMQLDALIVADGNNMRYLTTFTGGQGDGLVVGTQDKIYLITDTRYEEDLKSLDGDLFELIITRDYYQQAINLLTKINAIKIGFEDELSFKDFDYLDQMIIADELIPLPSLITQMREVKTDAELMKIKKACEISVQAFKQLIPKLHVGMTELEVANELDYLARKLGAEKASFDTIVASGYRGALPHGIASDKKIVAGDLVTIDFGYYYEGYTSDITRTVAFGEVDTELSQIYNIVQEAQKKVIGKVMHNRQLSILDQVGRDYITTMGYGDQFNHGMGHGIGLDIHEGPNIWRQGLAKMQTNNLLTIEPGIYLAGKGGVRIEDDIVVTDDGYINLTQDLTTDLIIIN